MGIFDRFRATALSGTNGGKPDTSGQDATLLIDEGHVLEAEGNLDEAMQRYLEAVRLAPDPARAHLNRGNILLLQGDLQGALDAFRTAIKHQPDYAGAYYNIGHALLGNGQLDEAAASYRRALEIQPDYAEVHCSLGVVLKDLGQLGDAVAHFQRALEINPDWVEAHTNLGFVSNDLYSMGNALAGKGQLESAVESYRKALEINPDFAEAYCNMGLALQEFGQLEEAVACCRRAIEIKPDLAEAHGNLGSALQKLGEFENAAASCRRAVNYQPDFAEAHSNLGIALKELGQLDSAVASCRKALEIKPDFAEAHNNLGITLHALGQLDEAETSYRRALEINPGLAVARYNLSLLFLCQGRYVEAWPNFEARYDPSYFGWNFIPPNLPFPQWQGEPLTGKSLVVWTEQGFGDNIQFARYFPMLKPGGVSRLTLVCMPPLKALLENIVGVDAVVSLSEAGSLPTHDHWIYAMSLPLLFATTVETIPASLPYLSVLPERLDKWRWQLPTDRLKVGLVWKGSATNKNGANRSLPSLSILAPLWSIPGITFISLQKGQGEDEAAIPPAGQPIAHMGSNIQDFADTAAIVTQLDLVICIDTAIAHLAGALNKPCWVLLPTASVTDWRWLRERTDSLWYPGVMRLFRQTDPDDWPATIREVAQALETWVDERVNAI